MERIRRGICLLEAWFGGVCIMPKEGVVLRLDWDIGRFVLVKS